MPPTEADAQDLIAAVQAGDEPQVRRLVASDPALAEVRDEQGVSALLVALYHGHPPVAAALRQALDELDVFEAAALGEREALLAALAADPGAAQAFSSDGFTALHLAAFFGQPGAATLLLERGATRARWPATRCRCSRCTAPRPPASWRSRAPCSMPGPIPTPASTAATGRWTPPPGTAIRPWSTCS